jgi:hypothetical protein
VLPQGGGLASYHVLTTEMPGYRFQPHPQLPPRFWVRGDATASTLVTSLDEVEKPAYAAVSAAFGHPDASRYDIILTSLSPEGIRFLEQEVGAAQELKYGPSPANRHLVIGSTRALIDPEQPTMPIVVVSVRALSEAEQVDHLPRLAPALPAPATRRTPDARGWFTDQHEDAGAAPITGAGILDGVVVGTGKGA